MSDSQPGEIDSGSMRVMAVQGDGFSVSEIPKPKPGPGQLRVRVMAAAINPADEKVASGLFVGRFLHKKITPLVVGYDVAGSVDALGEGVTDLGVGDPVFGHLAYAGKQDQGTFSEFVTLPRKALATKPDALSFEQAAAAPTVTMTGLQAMRDLGGLSDGGRVLIIGAGGGVGAVSVGIAKRLGAHVTAVVSTKDVERIRALGADEVIDRTQADPLAGGAAYDVVFDTPSVHSYGRCARIIRPGGAYVATLPGPSLFIGKLRTLLSSKRCEFITVASKRRDLELVAGWMGDGLGVPIDNTFPVAELASAFQRQAARDRSGKVVVKVADGW